MLWESQGRESRRHRRDEVARLDEEVTAFGELLVAHTFVPGRPGANADAVADYGRALDAYEQATRKLRTDRRLSLLSRRDYQGALHALDEGRHALACLDARLSGKPLPRRLPLCFFDPRHGPSVSEHLWAPGGGAQRLIAVCAADAVRLAEGVGPIVDAPVPDADGSLWVRVPAGSSSVPQQPVASAAAEPLRGAAVPGGKPRMRERYTKAQLVAEVCSRCSPSTGPRCTQLTP